MSNKCGMKVNSLVYLHAVWVLQSVLPFICALSITLNATLCVTVCPLTNSVFLLQFAGLPPSWTSKVPLWGSTPVFIADMLRDPQRSPGTSPFEEQLQNFIDELSTSLTVITSKKGRWWTKLYVSYLKLMGCLFFFSFRNHLSIVYLVPGTMITYAWGLALIFTATVRGSTSYSLQTSNTHARAHTHVHTHKCTHLKGPSVQDQVPRWHCWEVVEPIKHGV